MCTDESGLAVQPVRPIDMTDETCERFRDILAVKLQSKRISLRWIGRILGVSKDNVAQRLARMPDAAKKYYRKLSLEALD